MADAKGYDGDKLIITGDSPVFRLVRTDNTTAAELQFADGTFASALIDAGIIVPPDLTGLVIFTGGAFSQATTSAVFLNSTVHGFGAFDIPNEKQPGETFSDDDLITGACLDSTLQKFDPNNAGSLVLEVRTPQFMMVDRSVGATVDDRSMTWKYANAILSLLNLDDNGTPNNTALTIKPSTGDMHTSGSSTQAAPVRASATVTTPYTVTIASSGVFVNAIDGGWSPNDLKNYTEVNGRLTYTGTDTIAVRVSANIIMEPTTGNNTLSIAIFKNGTEQLACSSGSASGGSPSTPPVDVFTTLSTGDFLEPFVANLTGNQNIDILAESHFLVE